MLSADAGGLDLRLKATGSGSSTSATTPTLSRGVHLRGGCNKVSIQVGTEQLLAQHKRCNSRDD